MECPNCNGKMEYDSDDDFWECPYCGHIVDPLNGPDGVGELC